MCNQPKIIYVERGERHVRQEVACQKCWRCRNRKVNDYVGRALCEASTSDWAVSLTLTYADRKDLHDKIIHPPHFQNFVRSLRDSDHKLRYICSGETGSLRGKAHFHCILFGQGKPLQITKRKDDRAWHPSWPHGHLHDDWSLSGRNLSYILKYNFKDFGDTSTLRQTWFTLSKKPPLGSAYFDQLVAKNVSDGVFPRSFVYTPPLDPDPKVVYRISGVTRFNYILGMVDAWLERFPLDRSNLSANMVESLDQAFRKEMRDAAEHPTLPELLETFVDERRKAALNRAEADNRPSSPKSRAEKEATRRWLYDFKAAGLL